MKLSKIILSEILHYDPDFEREVDKLKAQGGKYLGSGDYGSVYELDGKAVKVTTDQDEIIHAQILKGKRTKNFVYIHNVNVINSKLAIITMQNMDEFKGSVPEEFIEAAEAEAESLGIDPEELDFVGDNVMVDPLSGKLRMVDV